MIKINKELKFKKLHPDAELPYKVTPHSAGFDLKAVSVEYKEENGIKKTTIYGTGLAVEIPYGYVGLLFPRSSVYKKDLSLANCVGVIDSDYRGEIKAIFRETNYPVTFSSVPLTDRDKLEVRSERYNIGDRICQLVIVPVPDFTPVEVEELSNTERGEGGFGSSGS